MITQSQIDAGAEALRQREQGGRASEQRQEEMARESGNRVAGSDGRREMNELEATLDDIKVNLRVTDTHWRLCGKTRFADEAKFAADCICDLENALIHIATMDVFTHAGEEPPHEIMRRIAAETLTRWRGEE